MTTVENAEKTEKTLPRLKQRYAREIRESLQKEFGYGNVMQIPGVVNGRGEHGRRRAAGTPS